MRLFYERVARAKLQALSSVLTAKSDTKPLNTAHNVVIKRDIKSLLQTTA
mgnify:CR=1|jgi:hypothetical protein